MCLYKSFFDVRFFDLRRIAVAVYALAALAGCGQSRSGVSTRCEVGLSEVSVEDVSSAVASPAQPRSGQSVVYYRTAVLDGVCLDAMTQHYGRSIDVTVFGESPDASSGYVSQVIFPGLRQLTIPLLKDQTDCAVAEDTANQRRQVSSLSCRRFFYHASNIGGLTKTGPNSTAVSNRAMELPWSDIDIAVPQHIYAAVLMPASHAATQRPSVVTVRFETVALP